MAEIRESRGPSPGRDPNRLLAIDCAAAQQQENCGSNNLNGYISSPTETCMRTRWHISIQYYLISIALAGLFRCHEPGLNIGHQRIQRSKHWIPFVKNH